MLIPGLAECLYLFSEVAKVWEEEFAWKNIIIAPVVVVGITWTIKIVLMVVLNMFCTTVPMETAHLPPKEWKCQPGFTENWTNPVKSAAKEDLLAYLKLRKVQCGAEANEDELRKLAAAAAYAQKAEEFGFKTWQFLDATYRKDPKNRPIYAKDMKQWNGWQSWFAEIGGINSRLGLFWVGQFVSLLHHTFCTTVALIAWNSDDVKLYRLAMYTDLGLNLGDLLLYVIFQTTGIDITLLTGFHKQGNFGMNGILGFLIPHHLGAFGLEFISLYFCVDRNFSCLMMVSLLGSGGVHLFAWCSGFWPTGHNGLVNFWIKGITYLVMIFTRVILWIYLCYRGVVQGFSLHWGMGIGLTAFQLLFSVFNYEFVKLYRNIAWKSLHFYLEGEGWTPPKKSIKKRA